VIDGRRWSGRRVRAAAVIVVALCVTGVAWRDSIPEARAETRVIDANARDVDASDGVVVWVRDSGRRTVLIRRVAGRVSHIPGVRSAGSFPELDLGRDARGRVLATYRRCDSSNRCRGPFVVDVRRGGERRPALHVPRFCRRPREASLWGARIAYLLSCPRKARSRGYFFLAGRHSADGLAPGAPYTLAPAPRDLGPSIFLSAISPGELGMFTLRGSPSCRTRVARLEAEGSVFQDVALIGTRAWWLHQTPSGASGATTMLEAATLNNSDCSVARRRAWDLTAIVGDRTARSFAVDGGSLFLLVDGKGAIAVPLQ
jgi:hypothetical protein